MTKDSNTASGSAVSFPAGSFDASKLSATAEKIAAGKADESDLGKLNETVKDDPVPGLTPGYKHVERERVLVDGEGDQRVAVTETIQVPVPEGKTEESVKETQPAVAAPASKTA